MFLHGEVKGFARPKTTACRRLHMRVRTAILLLDYLLIRLILSPAQIRFHVLDQAFWLRLKALL